ncbi:protein phyllopod-like [Anopheles albimanus]|uniref:ZAD domain-containing protein n=1 Tax=Anopheles albimanus TaxID=7167 RepID=A0A182FTK4_ANOAL|nr:protein phyllopod-like [Anopheles albimanus]XP_035786428.1 protein phyllopod-like [Anopheles albimanus]
MSSASSSTAAAAAAAGSSTANGATERSGPQVPNGQPAVEDGSGRGSGSDSAGSNGGGSSNLDQPGGSTSTSANATTTTGSAGAAASGTTAAVVRRKTNVCLICGIYTNLSFNIFEPRNGPNIIDVIYEKYKFRAERGDNADKHICFSCNNWLINWYSLQNSSGSRTYEPTPSSSRSSDSSNNRHSHKRTKHSRGSGGGNDKENARGARSLLRSMLEQHDQVSSTTAPIDDCGRKDRKDGSSTIATNALPYAKRICRAMVPSAGRYNRRIALKENHCQPSSSSFNVGTSQILHRNARMRITNREVEEESVAEVTSTTCEVDPCTMIRKMFEGQLIRMLEGQGTSVTREAIPAKDEVATDRANQTNLQSARSRESRVATIANPHQGSSGMDANGNMDAPENIDVVLSFDSAISEVIGAVPSLKTPPPASGGSSSDSCDNETFLRSLLDNHRQLYDGLTVSVIGSDRLQ